MITAKEAAERVKEIKNGQTIEQRMKEDREFRKKSKSFADGFVRGKEYLRALWDDTINRAVERAVHHTTISFYDDHSLKNTGENLAYLEGLMEAIVTAGQASGFQVVGKVITKPVYGSIYLDIGVGW